MRDPREGVQRGILIGFGLCFMGFYAAMLTDCSPVRVQATCGTLITYSAADQKALAAELRAHPDLVEVPRWLGDYVSYRDAVRACETLKKQD